MFTSSEIRDNLSHIDQWLETKGWPTHIPDELKVLAYLGYLRTEQERNAALLRKGRGGQFKEVSDDLIRADTYLAYRELLISRGHKNSSSKKVLQFCVSAAQKLHKMGEMTDDELSIWTKANLKSLQNTLRKGLRELEEYSRTNKDI
jgi:hypothetical protein